MICLIFFSSCDRSNPDNTPDSGAIKSGGLLTYFWSAYPDKEVLLLSEGDCNADGITDLVVVYREDPNMNHQATVYSLGDDFAFTHPISAPFEDCLLEWKDIDGRDPCELVVSGRRGLYFSYGVLRFTNGAWVDLFGGLEECC
jgi:hypothetical protein